MRNFLLFIGLTVVLSAPAAAEPEGFAGDWSGSIQLPGMALDIRVHLAQPNEDDGQWTGTIDIPMQNAEDIALSGIVVEADRIVFVIPGTPGDPTFNGTLSGDTISGTFAQSGQEFPFELARGSAEESRRPQDPTPPFPYSAEELTFTNGDVTLAGTITIPHGEGPFPAVVLLTGSGQQNRDEELFDHRPFWVIADHLSRNGVVVLRYDDRGVGGSDGDPARSTTSDFADDALAAIELLRGRDDVAGDKVGLLGHSEGAIIGPLAASRSGDVAFLVLLAAPGVPSPELMALQTELVVRAGGASDEVVAEHVEINRALIAAATSKRDEVEVRDELRRLIRRQNDLAPANQRPEGEALERMIEANVDNLLTPWYQYFLRYDPRPALRRITVPVLALNGSLDLQVVDTQNLPAVEAALAEAGNHDVTVMSMPGLNHMFQHATTGTVEEYGAIDETISPEVLDIMSRWIRARFVER